MSDSMEPAAAAVRALLGRLGDADEGLAEYLATCIATSVEEEDDQGCQREVQGLLCSFSDAFSALPHDQQMQHVQQLIREVAQGAPAPVDAIACDAQATQPCADVTNKLGSMDLKTAWQQALAGTSDEAPCSTSMAAPASETQTGIQSGVQELLCLCPEGTSAEYVAYAVTQLHQGDVQAAAGWLLDMGGQDLQAAQQRWQAQAEEQQLEAEQVQLEKQRLKKGIVQRFDLQEVKESKPLKKGQPAKPLTAWAPSKDGQQGGSHKLRYVDGVPVHTSQKYVIEKVQPDWDGGSKGKVFTKGKRGKGFV